MGQAWNNREEEANQKKEIKKKIPDASARPKNDKNDCIKVAIEPSISTVSGSVDVIIEKKWKPFESEEGDCFPACPCCIIRIPCIPCTWFDCASPQGLCGDITSFPCCAGCLWAFAAFLPWPCGGHGFCGK